MDFPVEENDAVRARFKKLNLETFFPSVKEKLEQMGDDDTVGFVGAYITRSGKILVGIEGDFTAARMDSTLVKINEKAVLHFPQLEIIQLLKLLEVAEKKEKGESNQSEG